MLEWVEHNVKDCCYPKNELTYQSQLLNDLKRRYREQIIHVNIPKVLDCNVVKVSNFQIMVTLRFQVCHICHAFTKNACVYKYLITPSAPLLFTLSDRKP
ncbi:hypothetical protein J6590_077754 [Homalodisca vitripennis]|nr:hypothetical protein J6590_077754 [Homalodisca vitripennis]